MVLRGRKVIFTTPLPGQREYDPKGILERKRHQRERCKAEGHNGARQSDPIQADIRSRAERCTQCWDDWFAEPSKFECPSAFCDKHFSASGTHLWKHSCHQCAAAAVATGGALPTGFVITENRKGQNTVQARRRSDVTRSARAEFERKIRVAKQVQKVAAVGSRGIHNTHFAKYSLCE